MFLFKKVVSSFLLPLPLVALALLLGLILLLTRRRRAGMIWIGSGLLLLLIFGSTPVADVMLRPLERRYPSYAVDVLGGPQFDPAAQQIPYVVVLGGGHRADPQVPLSSQLDSSCLTRLVEGIRIYRRHLGAKLLLSGGSGADGVPTAVVMGNLAIELGVPEEDLILEVESRDTKDEVRLIQPLIGVAPFILVTSAAHMPRAVAMFRHEGLDPIPAPTDHWVRGGRDADLRSFTPRTGNLRKVDSAIHEHLGMVWAWLRGQV